MRLPALLIAMCLLAGCAQQAAQQPPPPPPKPPLEFLGEWGTPGDGPGQLSSPKDIAADSVGNIYIVESENRFVHKFSPEGRPLLSFQDMGLRSPGCVAVDRGGAIYVCNSGRIVVFLPDGKRFRTMVVRKTDPDDTAVDEEGNVFVVGLGDVVEKLSPRGRMLKAWGRPGEGRGDVVYPSSLALGSDGFVYVGDAGACQVKSFTRNGEFIGAWQIADSEPGAVTEIASYGPHLLLLVLNQGEYRLQVHTPDGSRVFVHDLGGRFRGMQVVPRFAIVVPRRELLVLNPDSRRILRFRINF